MGGCRRARRRIRRSGRWAESGRRDGFSRAFSPCRDGAGDHRSYRADASIAAAARFTPASGSADAVRVELESTSPTFLAAIFGRHDIAIGRQAIAARQRYASFSIGSRLASLDGGLLNAYLSALTGSNVSLSVMDYRALAGADVDLFRYLPLLRTKAGLQAASFGDVLKSNVSTPQALDALASALSADGQPQAANAIKALLNMSGGRSISLAALIDAGPLAAQSEGGTGIAKVDALALTTAMLQLASPTRQVSLDLGAECARPHLDPRDAGDRRA
ncbi:MAG: TadG family pilus assembly protein [Candidatus Sphingomonas colombiensis]|nr:TadG family pilus assembly protein [Sphingomonas sp.]WEK41766.1 MAG: TadG family pilus assembly protein [Sphingomonas sp.]